MVSLIIANKNQHKLLSQTLKSLVSERCDEIIVVDDSSVDGSRELVKSYDWATLVDGDGSVGELFNVGVAASSNDVVLFLKPGMVLSRGWSSPLDAALANDKVNFGAFTMRIAGKHPAYRISEWGSRIRNIIFGNPCIKQGIFVRKDLFEQVGGFPNLPILEDAELVKELKNKTSAKILSHKVVNPDLPYRREGAWNRSCKNFMLQLRHMSGAEIETLQEISEGESNAAFIWYRSDRDDTLDKRLGDKVDAEQAASVSMSLTAQTISTVKTSLGTPKTIISADPESGGDGLFEAFGQEVEVTFAEGKTVGKQLRTAFDEQYARSIDRVIMVDPICPELSRKDVADAFSAMKKYDVVVGPTDDGECYLLGINKEHTRLFTKINYNKESSFQEVINKAQAEGLSYLALDRLADVDDMEDFRCHKYRGFIQY